ncbi:MAG: thiamine-phosphate kinase [Pyrinomonadaceae bacterium]
MSTPISMVSEFEFIKDLKSKYSLACVGDDCAVLPKDAETDLLLTADMLIEDIDFRLAWTKPEYLGHKALTVSLSDIAAMGGYPKWAMLSIGVPEAIWSTDFIERFYDGWFALANKYEVELVGGDMSRSPDRLVIDSIVGGEVPRGRAILRSGAKSGDAIIVSGTLGGSAAGLRLLEELDNANENVGLCQRELCQLHLQPLPQVTTGIYLRKHQLANAMIDLSDGLSSDLAHICRSSSIGARIIAERLPISANVKEYASSSDAQLDLALNGGEDFELLFTTDPQSISRLDPAVFSVIGEVTSNPGVIELIRDGKPEVLRPKGFEHFS